MLAATGLAIGLAAAMATPNSSSSTTPATTTGRSSPTSTPATTAVPRVVQANSPVPSGTWAVRTIDLTVVDRSRIAVVDGVMGPRHIGVRIFLPTSDRKVRRRPGTTFPLVVFAPGYLQCRSAYGPLLEHWASAGFAVAAVAFPLTSCHTPGQPEESDIVNQPADVAFAIRRLVELSAEHTGALAGRLDPSAIAVAGHSDGADTVLADLANTCCRDSAIRAGIVMAGAELASLGGRYFSQPTPPMLFVQGSADTVNPPRDTEVAFGADDSGPRWLLDLVGAGHFSPYEGRGPEESIVASVTTAFLDAELKDDPGALAHQANRLARLSQARLVSGDEPDPLATPGG